MNSIEREIGERAERDGQFAIAYGLLAVAAALRQLGTGDAASPMGAVEFLAVKVDGATSALGEIARAIHDR